jgi:hypothetical protein
MERAAARKRGKTIDPSKVGDVESWLKAYSKKYINVVIGDDGSFLVLDPARAAEDVVTAKEAPVKNIPHLMGDDYTVVLAAVSVSNELRAAAEEKYTTLRSGIKERVAVATTAYLEAEDLLLEAVANWESAPDAATRTTTAQTVGKATASLAEAEQVLREAMYPRRYVVTDETITRQMLVPASGDDRFLEIPIFRGINEIAEAKDRVVVRGATNAPNYAAAAAGAAAGNENANY